MSPEQRDAFVQRVVQDTLRVAEVKAKMLQAGVERGKTVCHRCGGTIRVRLTGPRKEMRAWCEDDACEFVNIIE